MEVKSLEDVRRVMADYDRHARPYQPCPVEARRRELREEKEREQARETREKQQTQNNWKPITTVF